MNFGRFHQIGAVIAVLATTLGGVNAQVDAQAVVEAARMSAAVQQSDLNGSIRKGRTKTPLALFLRGENIQFQYQVGGKWEAFHIWLGDDRGELREIIDGKTKYFPAKKLVLPVAGTDLNFEDLAFQFFYWPNPKYEGDERVNGQDCYKIRLNNPGRSGRYAVVYLWVHQKFGAFMRIRGHDKQGKLLKQFEVDSVMNIGGGRYTLRKMKVDTMNASGRVAGSTYVEFDKPKVAGPGGLR
jgi:hypothetical protein